MAIDTENKRRSVISNLTFTMYPKAETGSIDADDRRHIAGLYRLPAEADLVSQIGWEFGAWF